MKNLFPLKRVILIIGLAAAAVSSVRAETTNINLSSYYNDPWSSKVNGTSVASAPLEGNTGTGITFSYWSGEQVVVYAAAQTPLTVDFSPVTLASSPTVNALLNTAWGVPNVVNATIVFENNLDETAAFSLVGGQTSRDYNDSCFVNTLSGSNTDPSYGEVTSQEWWRNSTAPGSQRLGVATFTLPSSWAGTQLESMTISDPITSMYTDDVLLSALQVSSVPEPTSLALLAAGLAGLVMISFRRSTLLR